MFQLYEQCAGLETSCFKYPGQVNNNAEPSHLLGHDYQYFDIMLTNPFQQRIKFNRF